MASYLDKNGVLYMWSKIKNYVLDSVNNLTSATSAAIQSIVYKSGANDGKTDTLEMTKLNGNTATLQLKAATSSAAGLMSADDYDKLSTIASGAQVNQNAFSTIQLGDTNTKTNAGSPTSTLQLFSQSNSGLDITITGDSMVTFGLTAATTSKQGAMSASDKTKLNALPTNATLESTYAKKTDISGAYKYKGSVAAEANLPTTGQTTGDVYNIESASTYGPAGTNVAWDGTAWDALGGLFEIETITNAELDTICV